MLRSWVWSPTGVAGARFRPNQLRFIGKVQGGRRSGSAGFPPEPPEPPEPEA